MRTDEEKLMALHERADRIEHRRNVRIARIVSVAGFAACMVIVVIFAMLMPGVLDRNTSIPQNSGMSASVFTSGSALGFIVIGAMAFILGVLITILCYKLKRWAGENDRES